jgi:hypothetical protein
MNFEEVITKGRAQWIVSFECDDEKNNLTIQLTQEPELESVHRILKFFGVVNLESSWEDKDDNCLETIIGADEILNESYPRYFIHTDQREITFRASRRVQVNDV